MKNKKYLYSSGEFAKLNGINKRTLHYYNDIGLFCPEVKGENGYHFYSCFQTVQLELILTLRRIGLSIEDIKTYLSSPSDALFSQIIAQKKKLIDHYIEQLLSAKSFLQQKSDKLELGLKAEHGKIEQIYLPKRRILLSKPISGNYNEEDFSIAADFSLRLKDLFGLYDNFGSRISIQYIQMLDLEHYNCFFAYGSEECDTYDDELPAGNYLRTFCIGGWEKLPEVYQNILSYANCHKLTLYGYAYEEGLNEMSLPKKDDYITMITIPYTNNSTDF